LYASLEQITPFEGDNTVTAIRVLAPAILWASFGLAQAPPSPTLGALQLQNAPLARVMDVLARQLGFNYVLDPRVVDGVSITAHGDSRGADARDVIEVLLQSSHARLIEMADASRIVSRTPEAETRVPTVLHLMFLNGMTADVLSQLVLRLAGQEPAEVVRNASSNLLVIRSSAASIR
jgi:hypothetical protein